MRATMIMWAASFPIAVLSICLALFEIRETVRCAELARVAARRGGCARGRDRVASRPVPSQGTGGSRTVAVRWPVRRAAVRCAGDATLDTIKEVSC